MLNFCLLLSHLHNIIQKHIPFRRVSILPSQLPIHLPVQYMPCTTMAILCHWITNLAHSLVVVDLPLFRVQVTSTIHQLLQGTSVIQSHYSSHSFRIAAVMTAAVTGLSTTLIKGLGCWNSNAYETYVQFPPSLLHAIPSILACTDTNI